MVFKRGCGTFFQLLHKKITAGEYAVKYMDLVEQAKRMEEQQQHQETFKQSRQAKIFEDGMPPVWESFEQYYNETYGKDNNETYGKYSNESNA